MKELRIVQDAQPCRRVRVRAVHLLAAVGLVLAGTAARSQDETAELAARLKQLALRLREQRQEQARERHLLENQKVILAQEVEALKAREGELAARGAVLEEESSRLEKELADAGSQAQSLGRQVEEVGNLVNEKTAVLADHVNRGFPFDVPARREAVVELAGGAGSPVEKLRLLWQLYVQEYRRGGEIELVWPRTVLREECVQPSATLRSNLSYTAEMEDGARLQGRILRIGEVGAAFLSDDGATAALLVNTPGGVVWRRATGRGQLRQVQLAFEVAAGRRAPQLVIFAIQARVPEGGR